MATFAELLAYAERGGDVAPAALNVAFLEEQMYKAGKWADQCPNAPWLLGRSWRQVTCECHACEMVRAYRPFFEDYEALHRRKEEE